MDKLLSDIPKRRRELIEIIEDGSAKTFVYKDLEEKSTKVSFWSRVLKRDSKQDQEETEE